MLGQHPQLYGVPELNLFVTDTMEEMLQRYKGMKQFMMHGLLRTVAQLYSGEQSLAAIEMANRWISRYREATCAEVYYELCDRVAPLRIVDKSPIYSASPQNLQRLKKTFPHAHFIYLVRHPRTQGQSVLKVKGGAVMAAISDSVDYSTNPPTIDPQVAWYKMQWDILEFLSEIPREQQLHLRGEDLLSEPDRYFEKICRWLGLDWSEAALDRILSPEKSAYACIGPHGAHLGNDPNFLKSPEYRWRKIEPSHLEGPLPWRRDSKGFRDDVLDLAQLLGYE